MQGPELFPLIRNLLAESESRFAASVAGWSRPISAIEMRQLDTIDLMLQRWSEKGKYKASPRPWDKKPVKKKPSGLSRSEVHKRLRPHLYK